MKTRQPDPRPINKRFFKVTPAIDNEGKPLIQNPPINKKGFWEKPLTTAGILGDHIEDVKRQEQKSWRRRK